MTYKRRINCLHYSFIGCFLLMLQVAQAQTNFSGVDKWLSDNLGDLGGRAVLLVYKDGNQVYAKAENGMNRRQKMAGKFMARKTGKSADEILKDFD